MKGLIFASLTFLFSLTALADRSRPGWWLGAFSKAEVGSNWNGWIETQVRNNLESGRVDQMLFRTGLLHSIGEYEIGALIGFVQTGSALERRFSFQHGMSYSQWDSSKLSHRLRLEWRDFAENTDDALRFRYLARYTQKMDLIEAVLWNEVFMNLSDESRSNQGAVERNRIFLGAQVVFGQTKAEIGYMNQAIFRFNEKTFEHLGIIYWIF